MLDQGRHFVDVFILNHNVERFTSTVHNHPGPVLVLPAGAPGRPLPLVGPRGARARPRSSPRASRADLFAAPVAGAAARLLLARGLEAPRLHPALHPAARHPHGPRRRPPGPRRTPTPARGSRPRRRARRPRCWRRSSPRRPAALFQHPGAAVALGRSRSAPGPSSWPSSCLAPDRRPTRRAPSACSGSAAAGSCCCSSCAAPPILARRESGRAPLRARAWAARCWPGAPGAPPGWPATSTTTGRCARSAGERDLDGGQAGAHARAGRAPSAAASRRWARSRSTCSRAGPRENALLRIERRGSSGPVRRARAQRLGGRLLRSGDSSSASGRPCRPWPGTSASPRP